MSNINNAFNLFIKAIPFEILSQIQNFESWAQFLNTDIIQFLERSYKKKQKSEFIKPKKPVTRSLPRNGINITIRHRFTEDEMNNFGDDLIISIKKSIRENPSHDRFEGEEVLACWLESPGKDLPSKLPGIGNCSEGCYIMYMDSSAKQKPHQHGLKIRKNKYLEGSGVRFLIGLIGSNHSTIRHSEGVIKLSRGDLITILFEQNGSEPSAAHQFWNEGKGIGNTFLSFHQKDFMEKYKEVDSDNIGSKMINLRTYYFDNSVFGQLPDHGFKI